MLAAHFSGMHRYMEETEMAPVFSDASPPNNTSAIAGLALCGWLDQMSAQPAEQERAFRELFEDVGSRPKTQDGPYVA